MAIAPPARVRDRSGAAEDDAELRALLRQMPMARAIEVTFEREPSFLSRGAIQGGTCRSFWAA